MVNFIYKNCDLILAQSNSIKKEIKNMPKLSVYTSHLGLRKIF